MSAVIFAGPSLRAADRAASPGLRFLPPARQGDLYAAACARPLVIGFIDGYFDGVPAVLHKEILWALSQGIAVFGAASMGALRAAEMHGLGMVGVGAIFRDYRDGVLTDDDEVALIHGPAELDHPALSLPMVDLRATLAHAVRQGVLEPQAAADLAARQKAVFYKQRNWPDLLAQLATSQPELADWLAHNRVEQKRADALELVAAVKAHLAAPREAPPAPRFAATAAWTAAPWRHVHAEAGVGCSQAAVLDQLRLDPVAYRQCRMQALLRHLARGRPGAGAAAGDALAAALAELRHRHGLWRQADLIAWAEAQDLDADGLGELLADHGAVEGLARGLDARLGRAMLDQLRWDGRYAVLRAQAVARLAMGDHAAPQPLLLLDGFFRGQGMAVPADLAKFATDLGFADLDGFLHLLAHDHARQNGRAAQPDLPDDMACTARGRSPTV